MMSKRFRFLAFCVLFFMIVFSIWRGLATPAGAQSGGEPGSASDPVLTRASLENLLNGLTEGTRGELDELKGRLDRVEDGIAAVQAALKDSFPDLIGHPAGQAVNYLRARGIISGYPDGRFHPDDPVSRAALAVMLAKAKGLALNPGAAGFKDLAPGHWAAGAIGAVKDAGYLRGYPDGSFRSDRSVTRAEVAAVLYNAFPGRAKTPGIAFGDLKGHWAEKVVAELAAAGVVEGYADGTFRPDRAMTRADLALALWRLMQQELQR